MSSQDEFGIDDEDCEKKDLTIEGTLYRFTSSKKARKYWCKLYDKDLYCKIILLINRL
jgi:hypothetical protein